MIAMDSGRDLAYHHDGCYLLPAAARPPVGTRSSSVSSSSSSASYTAPFSAVNAPHGTISRTMSPASGISDSGAGALTYTRNHYRPLTHQLPHPPQGHVTSMMPSPSQYFEAQVSNPLPLYSPVPAPRHYSRASVYNGYPVAALQSQASALSYQPYDSLYASFPTTAYSSPALPSYHAAPLPHYPAVKQEPGPPRKPSGLLKLSPEITLEIQKHFSWWECRQLYQVSRWFHEHFNPARLPEQAKLEGILYAEQYYGRYGEVEDSEGGGSKRCQGKSPPWFGCYHCFRILGLDRFELYKWGNSSRDNDDIADRRPAAAARSYSNPAAALTPPSGLPSPTNPHYDPSLTRSSLTASNRRASTTTTTNNHHHNNHHNTAAAAAAAATHAAAGTGPGPALGSSSPDDGTMDPRIRETWGTRRFCIDCGLRKGFYRPGDLIELQKPLRDKEAVWVCRCLVLHWRPASTKCETCKAITPLSPPSRRGR